MPQYADIYVLSGERNPAAIDRFLDAFVPFRIEATDEYPVPQFSASPRAVFLHASELIQYCCAHPSEEHSIYWHALDGMKPEHAMIFFLPDNHIICGISTDSSDQQFVHSQLERLKEHFASEDILLREEECPPFSADLFRREARKNSRAGSRRPSSGDQQPF